MEITKPELLSHIQEIQCRYIKFFNKYMKIMAYGGKPDVCMYEWIQMLRNYLRILKQSYVDYHLICESTPNQGGTCNQVTSLVRETLFQVTTVNIDGITYDSTNLPPSPYSSLIDSYLDILNTTQFTWPPFLGDANGDWTFNADTGLLTLDLGASGIMYMSLVFNCDSTIVTAYTTLENASGDIEYAVLTMTVEGVEYETLDSGCCRLSNLVNTTMSTVGEYIYSESGNTYIPSDSEEFPTETYVFNETSVDIYINDVIANTYSYTYDFTTGQLTLSNGDIGFFQFTCSFNNVILNLYSPDSNDVIQKTIYFSIDTIGNSTCITEKCNPEYSYCLSNLDIQNIISKSYQILNQVCNC